MIAEYTSSGTALSKEYGYRNGKLLITATVASAGWGTPPTIEDNPLKDPQNPESFKIKSIHITQLRTAINALRSHLSMSQYSWTTSANPGDWVTADPILEMRVAVDEALGLPSPNYTAGLAQHQPVLADHIQELRNRVLNAWNSGTTGTDVRWLVSDQLGTPRIILDQSGSFSSTTRHDYLPFGEELTAGGRTWDHGYKNSDMNRQKFTGYERDDETELDYAQARYFSHGQGRFVSPDPGMAGADVGEPQSWNGYSYVINNPLNLVDPLGMYFVGGGTAETNLQEPHKKTEPYVDEKNIVHNPDGSPYELPTEVVNQKGQSKASGAMGGRLSSNAPISIGAGPGGGSTGEPARVNGSTHSVPRDIQFVGGHFGTSAGLPIFSIGGQISVKRDMYGNWYFSAGPTFGPSLSPVTGGFDLGKTYLNGKPVIGEEDVKKAISGPSAGVSYTGVVPMGSSASLNTVKFIPYNLGPLDTLNTMGPVVPTGLNGTSTLHAGTGPELSYSPQYTWRIPKLKF